MEHLSFKLACYTDHSIELLISDKNFPNQVVNGFRTIEEPSHLVGLREIKAKLKDKLNSGTNDNVKVILKGTTLQRNGNSVQFKKSFIVTSKTNSTYLEYDMAIFVS